MSFWLRGVSGHSECKRIKKLWLLCYALNDQHRLWRSDRSTSSSSCFFVNWMTGCNQAAHSCLCLIYCSLNDQHRLSSACTKIWLLIRSEPVLDTHIMEYIYLSKMLFTFYRSPGGTPMKEKPKPSENSDAASLIALALKRKFANRVLHSPLSPQNASDKENDYESPDSPRNPVITDFSWGHICLLTSSQLMLCSHLQFLFRTFIAWPICIKCSLYLLLILLQIQNQMYPS